MTTYVYAGAADWGGKDPAKCNRGLYRLATDTGTWTALERGLPDQVEVRCLTMHPTQPGVVFAGTQAGPYRSTDAGDTWERMHFPGDEPVVWSFAIHPADARVMYAGTQDMAVYRSEDGGGQWRRLTVPRNPDGLCVMGFPTRMIRLAIDPTNPDELYAGVEVGGLVRSLDGGTTWTDCNAPLLELATQERYTQKHGPRRASEGMMDTHALAISAAQPGTVFLANRLGVFRSDDKGGWCPSIACMKGRQCDAGRWLIESADASQMALDQRQSVEQTGSYSTTTPARSRSTSTFWPVRRREFPAAKARLVMV